VAQYPAVAQCAIIGIPNESWGEEVYAIVIRRLGTKVDPVDIIAFCKDRPLQMPTQRRNSRRAAADVWPWQDS
jgi:acyl-CoA synthetase (AMP-forming)/AMP-acid ligase II